MPERVCGSYYLDRHKKIWPQPVDAKLCQELVPIPAISVAYPIDRSGLKILRDPLEV